MTTIMLYIFFAHIFIGVGFTLGQMSAITDYEETKEYMRGSIDHKIGFILDTIYGITVLIFFWPLFFYHDFKHGSW